MGPVIAVIGMPAADLTMIVSRMPDEGESTRVQRYSETVGGKGANAAVACYRSCHVRPKAFHRDGESEASNSHGSSESQPATTLSTNHEENIEVHMIGSVGGDVSADWIRKSLAATGVQVSGLRTVEGERSATAYMVMDDHTGENRALFIEGATAAWAAEDFRTVKSLSQGGPRPDFVVASLKIRKHVQEMIMTAGQNDIDLCLNAAPGVPMTSSACYKYLTHLIVNETEAAIMYGCDLSEVNEGSWTDIAG